tara:strand:+ start:3030 stop:3455 length:426 start_codon:yes stop_codon:yes gene_type:complete
MTFITKLITISASLVWAASVNADDLSLYKSLGEKAGIERIITHTLDLSFTDPRTEKQFTHTKKARLIGLITDQICELTGGPCTYKGLTMKKGHIKLGTTEREFNALVEQLQAAMEAEKVPYRMQNKLLALLAPMKADIVER